MRSVQIQIGIQDSQFVISVYAHCIFCSARPGDEESIETFAPGQSLAFDAGGAA
jgi:hypothetical protein